MIQEGIYHSDTYGLVYITVQYVDNILKYKRLTIGTSINTYSTMRTFQVPSIFSRGLKPLALGWLPNDVIPSDLYPELFI